MSKAKYSHIGIIYNPISTGEAPLKAKKLFKKLQTKLPDVETTLYRTKHAGHAEELAYELASHTKNPLIISVSGDGGYHEVINGALRARADYGTDPICTVHDAGNANDHHRTLKENPLTMAIVVGNVQQIDLVKVVMRSSNNSTVRFAHSYVGLGLTPAIAVELNRHQLNRWRELMLVFKTFWSYKPFFIEIEGKQKKFDSLVCANINQMAKVLKLSQDGRPDDGKFELIELPHSGKLRLLAMIAKSVLFGLGVQPHRKSFKFTVIKDLPMQLDGELQELKGGTVVTISSEPNALRTLL